MTTREQLRKAVVTRCRRLGLSPMWYLCVDCGPGPNELPVPSVLWDAELEAMADRLLGHYGIAFQTATPDALARIAEKLAALPQETAQ